MDFDMSVLDNSSNSYHMWLTYFTQLELFLKYALLVFFISVSHRKNIFARIQRTKRKKLCRVLLKLVAMVCKNFSAS